MQQTSAFDQASELHDPTSGASRVARDDDLPTFSFPLDTPSRFLSSTSPNPWSFSSTHTGGLTPSLFASLDSKGFTPSFAGVNAALTEPNPFELSLSGSSSASRRHSVAEGMGGESDKSGSGSDNDFDLLSSTTLFGGTGRKRALSSPAIHTPGGTNLSNNLSFLSNSASASMAPPLLPVSAASVDAQLAAYAFKPSKRPRMDSLASSSTSSGAGGSQDKIFSDVEKTDADASPASSAVDTPPNSSSIIPLPAIKEDAPLALGLDIPVSAPPPPPSTSPFPPAPQPSTFTLLSQLQSQRSALLASGATTFSQSQPLPIKGLGANGGAASGIDIPVPIKPEPLDINASPTSSTAARPPVGTRVSGRKPTAPSNPSNPYLRPSMLHDYSSTEGSYASGSSSSIALAKKKTTGGAGGAKKKPAAPKKAASAPAADAATGPAEGEDEDEDDVKRKQFLERNRVAACKSRAKKKEKVGQMEKLASDLCARNQTLQQTALNLRQEALTLRQLMQAHNGCNCEHAQGYLTRDMSGGGIATIDALAGQTLTLDYSIPPSMGRDDDVYSFLDRGERGPPPIAAIAAAQAQGAFLAPPVQQPLPPQQLQQMQMQMQRPGAGPAIPIVSGPSPVQPKRRQPSEPAPGMPSHSMPSKGGMATRPLRPPGVGVGVPVPLLPASHLNAHPIDIPVRSTSAPPSSTPGGWGVGEGGVKGLGAQPRGDYFAPKEMVRA
ncbi:hypothetical protein JCM11641_006467 [Rhodosporidiobolus odoratus]